ncbi:hypothetical protein [Acidisoma sp. 7E03]
MSVALSLPSYPEPIPGGTQLAALPFLAAVEGYLRKEATPAALRLTLHRVMSRNGGGYLQQVTAYLGTSEYQPASAGRVFPVTTGIIGHAYRDRRVTRTRKYESELELRGDLKSDMEATGDSRDISGIATSYVAIPFLFDSSDEVVAILYAEAQQFNLFADDRLMLDIMALCDGFCRALDALTDFPLPGIRNFQLEPGKPVSEAETKYPRLQETIDLRPVPSFQRLRSFNFQTTE